MIENLPEPIAYFLLGISPFVEINGATILAVAQGRPEMIIFAFAGSMTAVLLILTLWDILGIEKLGRMVLGKMLERKLEQFGKRHEKYGTLALAAFIGLTPFPFSGVYTGTLVAKIFGLPKRYIILGTFIGAILTSFTAYLVTTGALNVFDWFF